MNIVDRIKELASKRGVSISKVEEECGLAANSIYSWKKRTPGVDKIKAVADYFDVSIDYLLGRSDKPHYYSLTDKDDKAIDTELERIMDGLTDKSGVSFLKNNAELSENDRDLLAASLRSSLELAHEMAKKKFTPKKYRGSERND